MTELPFSSWQAQSVAEAHKLTELVRMDEQAVIMGDLNSSPGVPEHDVKEDMEGEPQHSKTGIRGFRHQV